MPKIGTIVQFKLKDDSKRLFTFKGMVNGRIRMNGGWHYIIKSFEVIEPKEIRIKKVTKIK